jgi:hypothetical protein
MAIKATTHGVSGEGRSLEDVEEGASVERRLLVDGSHESRPGLGSGEEVSLNIELEAYRFPSTRSANGVQRKYSTRGKRRTLGDLVLELNLSLEDVGGGPGLSEGDAVLGVDVLALDVTSDGVGLGVAGSSDLEGDVVGSAGLPKGGKEGGSKLASILESKRLYVGTRCKATGIPRRVGSSSRAEPLLAPHQPFPAPTTASSSAKATLHCTVTVQLPRYSAPVAVRAL